MLVLTAHQVRSLHAAVVKTLGNPTILFNNAGLTLKSGIKSITEISIDEFEYTWRANCGSAFLMTQLCLPEMEKAGWGRVIFCSSVAGFNGGVVGPHYASVSNAFV
jgi:3-oxoacyl-[acyl-carrier protein] reductase